MPNRLIIELLKNDRVLEFAKQQFKQYVQVESFILANNRIVMGTFNQLKKWDPIIADYVGANFAQARFSDEFVLFRTEETLYIIGQTSRAVLFGVYHYFEMTQGINWGIPAENPTVSSTTMKLGIGEIKHIVPKLERRGFVVETIDELNFIIPLIDWLAKNKINELFLTFTLWDKVRFHITDMLLDRGIELTLGGHSASFFFKMIMSNDESKKQIDYTDLSWQKPFIKQVISYCQFIKPLKRISLWPEDIKQQTDPNFLTHYIHFTEQLKSAFVDLQLPIEVEHIAYNAGLAWDMLERNGQATSNEIDTLYAYWGRDYTEDFTFNSNPHSRRAYEALQDWKAQTAEKQRKLTIFEYYSDHFMLTPLFPMLAKRIESDINHYVSEHVYGMTNLIVPCPEKHYNYQWNQYFNSYVFAQLLWDKSLEDIIIRYCCYFPVELQRIFLEWVSECERLITPLTKWNVPLFPAGAGDVEKITSIPQQDSLLILQTLLGIVELSEQYLLKVEIKESIELHSVLTHYKNYTNETIEKWKSLIT